MFIIAVTVAAYSVGPKHYKSTDFITIITDMEMVSSSNYFETSFDGKFQLNHRQRESIQENKSKITICQLGESMLSAFFQAKKDHAP